MTTDGLGPIPTRTHLYFFCPAGGGKLRQHMKLHSRRRGERDENDQSPSADGSFRNTRVRPWRVGGAKCICARQWSRGRKDGSSSQGCECGVPEPSLAG